MENDKTTNECIILGAGCFWCVEAVFARIDGVCKVTSGYMGGALINPTYEAICTGTTGHAEVVKVAFDPAFVSLDTILDWFWRSHDPTTLNRQGADSGTQYRSAIFYENEEQRAVAEASRRAADASGRFPSPIVTEITAASAFYPAEGYHQDFYANNRSQPYCRFVIDPKMEKLGLSGKPDGSPG